MRSAHILICGIILVLAVLFPNVTAENDSMKLLVLLDREDYSHGDTGKVTIHIFDKGEYIDSDKIPNCLIKSLDFTDETERNITLEKKSTGIFEGDFKILTGDADDFDSMVIKADATYGKSDENDMEYNMEDDSQFIDFSSEEEESEDVRVSIINAPPSMFPGDTFTLRIEVEKGGVLTNADDLEVKYELAYEETDSDESELPYDKVGTGIYEAEMEVPKNIKESCDIDIEAEATIDEEYDFDYESVKVDFFSVWYNKGSVGQTICTFDVYVADRDGKAVSEADIKLKWDEGRRSSENEETKLTDIYGKASFDITYEKNTGILEIGGGVLKDGKTQFFSGDIKLKENAEKKSEWREPFGFGLDVVFKKYLLSGESPYSLECRAFLDGQRISETEIYYYLYSEIQLVAHGVITTDINGEFLFEFSYSPSRLFDGIMAYFETVEGDFSGRDERENSLDGKEYANGGGYILFETNEVPDLEFDETSIKINVEKLNHGGLTGVTVTGIPKDFLPTVSWIPSPVNSLKDMFEWEKTFEWNLWGGEGLKTQEISVSEGKFTCKIMIPEFMPSGKYTVTAGYVDEMDIYDPDFSLEDVSHINNVILEPGESGSSTETTETAESSFFSGSSFILLSAGILAIILVVIIVFVLMVKRKKRKAESEALDTDEQFQQMDHDSTAPDQTDHDYPQPQSQTVQTPPPDMNVSLPPQQSPPVPEDPEQKTLPEHQFTP